MSTTALVYGTYEAPAKTKKPKLGARTYAWILSKAGPRTKKVIVWGAGLYLTTSVVLDLVVTPALAFCTASYLV